MRHYDIAALICIAAESIGHELSAQTCAVMADELKHYPPVKIAAALRDCMHTLKGRLTLAAIIERMHADDGHPHANEAWGIALDATDEYKTVLMTAQIQEALSAARPVLDLGDNVGARMAFIATYERLVAAARKNRIKADWKLSLGFDAKDRESARQAGIDSGKLALEAQKNTRLLTQESGFIAPPESMAASEQEKARANIKAIRDMMNAALDKTHLTRQKQAQRQRVKLYLLKRQQRALLQRENERIAALQSQSKKKENNGQRQKEASA